ncbi:MAG: hypothetical protein QOD60_2150 [Solirubrobacterales bacterium]|nr:hypothetical protein [Solirubrobacterales bacterium]
MAGALVAAALALLAAAALAGFGPRLKPGLKSKRVLSTKSVSISGVDHPQRYQVYCPRGMRPLGGGASADPPPDARGGGAYLVSSERLGQQQGWHISMAQVGRSGTTSVKVQVLCRRYRGNIEPEEKFVKSRTYKNIGPGETKQFTQTCPKGRELATGGYLSSHFFSNKGVYVTESRMSGERSWTVSATGVAGGDGGQISAIAYCVGSHKPLLAEVASAPATVSPGHNGTATTPDCPPGKHLIAGGYNAPPTLRVFAGAFAGMDNWTASAASYTGSGQITAYGYCL